MALLGAADGHVRVHDVVLLDGAEASGEAVTVLGPDVAPGQAHGEEEGDQSHGHCSVSEGRSHIDKLRCALTYIPKHSRTQKIRISLGSKR